MINSRHFRSLCVTLVLTIFLLLGASSAYAVDAQVLEYEMFDNQLLLYVKDVGQVSGVSAALGQYPSDEVQYKTLSDSDLAMKTLILLDNSLSIPQESRKIIKEQLLELIAARKSNEYFAIATVGEQVNIKQGFTNDYQSLKDAITLLEFQKQETYLINTLYTYLADKPFASDGQCFTRILLISDGGDKKDIGYTVQELQGLLQDRAVPIYSLGVRNKKNSNSAELERMFALTRFTGAETFMLSDLSNKSTLGNKLAEDWQNLAVWVQIPEAAQDGSLQTLTLNLRGEEKKTISLDNVRMPLMEKTQEPVEPTVPVQATPVEPEPQPNLALIIGLTAGGVLLLVLLIGGIAVLMIKKRREQQIQTVTDAELQQEAAATVILENNNNASSGDTMLLWNVDKSACPLVTLTDCSNHDKIYQKPISQSLLVGRNRQKVDICLDYDMTISGVQCEITRENGEFFIKNITKNNITKLNGNKIVDKLPIYDGGIITMGNVSMQIKIED